MPILPVANPKPCPNQGVCAGCAPDQAAGRGDHWLLVIGCTHLEQIVTGSIVLVLSKAAAWVLLCLLVTLAVSCITAKHNKKTMCCCVYLPLLFLLNSTNAITKPSGSCMKGMRLLCEDNHSTRSRMYAYLRENHLHLLLRHSPSQQQNRVLLCLRIYACSTCTHTKTNATRNRLWTARTARPWPP